VVVNPRIRLHRNLSSRFAACDGTALFPKQLEHPI
jgi:hypothetical protein